MMYTISNETLRRTLRHMTDGLAEAEAELNRLDATLGDGDCGTTIASLARAVRTEIDTLPEDLGSALTQLARIIGRVSGSSFSGVLMIGLIRAGTLLEGRTTIDASELSGLLRESIDAMSRRGGAKLGDKSMLDGLASIASALEPPLPLDISPAFLADQALTRAIDRFRPKPCSIGRARLAGERSIGQDDPGMVAVKRAVQAICTDH